MRLSSLVPILVTTLLPTACQPQKDARPSVALTRALGASAPTRHSAKTTHVTFLHTNDEHSRLVPFVVNGEPAIGGVVARKAMVDAIRREGGSVFLLSGGDYAQGLSVYDVWQGSAELMTMNALSYDAITLGNHQFDLGAASLGRSLAGGTIQVLGQDRRVPAAAMPVVVSNLDVSGEPALRDVVRPRAIVERGGVRIGLVGAITDTLPKLVELPASVAMKPTVESVQEQVDALTREGIDKIVLLSHSGSDADLALVPKLTGVDVVVSGHDHAVFGDRERLAKAGLGAHDVSRVKQPYPVVAKAKDERTTLVVSAGQWGQILGRLDVDFDAQGAIVAWRGEPIVVRCDASHACEGDAALEREIAEYMRPVETVTGRVLTELPHAWTPSAEGESEIGLRMADATLRAARPFGATLAMAQGDFRAGLPAGKVTYGDAYAAWPFVTRIVVVELTGAALTEVVERWLKSDDAPPQVAGMRIDYTLPAGAPRATAKLDQITIEGARVVPSRKYKVALDAYVVGFGGDPAISGACAKGGCVDTHVVQREAFIDELTRATPNASTKARLVRR